MRVVDRFYRVTFADQRAFRLWIEQVLELASILRDMLPDLRDTRPVVFVPLSSSRETPREAYMSAGAWGLAVDISGGATVDPSPIATSELPPGLGMLVGEGIDAAGYAGRHASQSHCE